jgi:S-adenosyl-L-methionine hydrolase (adenosine-forming)
MEQLTPQPIITLTTDFGLADHYVGTMKGVILERCPHACIVDISHQVPAFSILAGAYTVGQAAPYFPAGTTHVVVVDPGVGTARKAILVEALGQRFIAPDNGVLSMICARDTAFRARLIINDALFLASPSSTFHGRDVFAPVAAALAGFTAKPEDVGPALSEIKLLPNLFPAQTGPNFWTGTVLSIDHFGNVITNFESARFSSRSFELYVSNRRIPTLYRSFGYAPPGVCFSYFGSSGYIELGMNQGNAAAHLGASPGSPVKLRTIEVGQ